MNYSSLITTSTITIAQLAACLGKSFESVRMQQNRESLRIEHLPLDFVNELLMREGREQAIILDKPSTWETDYAGDEQDLILSKIPSPKVFIVGYTDSALLERIILALNTLEVLVVDDGYGNLRVFDHR